MASWLTDAIDLISKFVKWYEIIDEGQVGLHLRGGRPVKHRVRLYGPELEDIVQEEKEVLKQCGGYSKFLMEKQELPAKFKRGMVFGLPKHERRYKTDTDLKPGVYFMIPFLDTIYTDHNQERAIFSNISNMVVVPTTDKHNVAFGYVITQRIADYYRAYTKGDDYEDLLRAQASIISAKLAVGKSCDDWTRPALYKEIAHGTLDKLNKFTNNRWGVSVSDFSLTQIMIDPALHLFFTNPSTQAYIGAPGSGVSGIKTS